MTNRQRKLKLIHARPEEPLGKVVHDSRGTAIWAGEVSLALADGLALLEEKPARAPGWDPYNREALPQGPEKAPRR